MERVKKLVQILLFPHIFVVSVLVFLGTVLLLYAFLYDGANPILVYASYFLSAYALTLVCVRVPVIYRKIKQIKQENKYIRLYTSEAGLRVKISLYLSFSVNVLYVLMQLVLGCVNHSVWFYSLAGYYFLLVIMRFFLLKEMKQDRWGTDRFFELLLYRFCGILLLCMNIALAAVVFYIVWQNQGFEHHYIVTIAMATYTFTTLTMAIRNLVRYRKYNSPVMSASKVISLVASLVSMLSLETAMITAFGDGNDALFRRVITGVSGTAICISVLVMAIYMIVSSTKEIKILKGDSDNGR